jgi:hypothetical protein
MNENKKSGYILLGIILSLGLIISVMILSGTLKQIKYSDHFITVKGYAERKIVSDFGSWSCQFSTGDRDLNTAYSKLMANKEKIIKYLVSSGINRNNISESSIITTHSYKLNEKGYATNELDAYKLSQSLFVWSNDVHLIKSISVNSSSLLAEGIELMSYDPRYLFSKLEGMKKEMLGAATREAKERAEFLAKNTGSKVGGIKSAEQGVFQITPLNSTEVSDYGMYDETTIEKSIKAVVTVEFLIK